MSNAWQDAQERRNLKALSNLVLTVQTVYDMNIEEMRQEVVKVKTEVIQKFVAAETGGTLQNLGAIVTRCHIQTFPDGAEIVHWDGKPRILFHAVDLVPNGEGRMQIAQKYEMLRVNKDVPEEPTGEETPEDLEDEIA